MTTIPLDPGKMLRMLLLCIFLLLLGSTVGQLLFRYAPTMPFRRGIANLLSVDYEQSIPTAFSFVLLLGCALGSWLVSRAQKQLRSPYVRHWSVIAALFVLVALDETLALHEMTMGPLRARLHADGLLYFTWVVPGASVALILTLLLARMVFRLPAPILKLAIASAASFLGGALGFEMIGGAYVDRYGGNTLGYVVCFTIEEALEMFGSSLFIYTTLRYLREYLGGVAIRVSPAPAPEPGRTRTR